MVAEPFNRSTSNTRKSPTPNYQAPSTTTTPNLIIPLYFSIENTQELEKHIKSINFRVLTVKLERHKCQAPIASRQARRTRRVNRRLAKGTQINVSCNRSPNERKDPEMKMPRTGALCPISKSLASLCSWRLYKLASSVGAQLSGFPHPIPNHNHFLQALPY